MKLIRNAILGLALFGSLPASAAVIDLRAASCKDFVALGQDDLAYTLAFLDGYYRTEDDPLVIDQERAGVNAKKLADYCVANPGDGLIAATEKLFKKD